MDSAAIVHALAGPECDEEVTAALLELNGAVARKRMVSATMAAFRTNVGFALASTLDPTARDALRKRFKCAIDALSEELDGSTAGAAAAAPAVEPTLQLALPAPPAPPAPPGLFTAKWASLELRRMPVNLEASEEARAVRFTVSSAASPDDHPSLLRVWVQAFTAARLTALLREMVAQQPDDAALASLLSGAEKLGTTTPLVSETWLLAKQNLTHRGPAPVCMFCANPIRSHTDMRCGFSVALFGTEEACHRNMHMLHRYHPACAAFLHACGIQSCFCKLRHGQVATICLRATSPL